MSLLQVDNIHTFYGKIHALKGVSLAVEPGQIVTLIGANGAGKSTLLKVIAGNLTPTSGRVRVNGTISSLLSIVPAWDDSATGLENIRFNLFLQGMSSSAISRAVEDIVMPGIRTALAESRAAG